MPGGGERNPGAGAFLLDVLTRRRCPAARAWPRDPRGKGVDPDHRRGTETYIFLSLDAKLEPPGGKYESCLKIQELMPLEQGRE